MEARAPFPSPSLETPTTPALRPDAAMARCGALPPRATTMTANGASVPIKVCVFGCLEGYEMEH